MNALLDDGNGCMKSVHIVHGRLRAQFDGNKWMFRYGQRRIDVTTGQSWTRRLWTKQTCPAQWSMMINQVAGDTSAKWTVRRWWKMILSGHVWPTAGPGCGCWCYERTTSGHRRWCWPLTIWMAWTKQSALESISATTLEKTVECWVT